MIPQSVVQWAVDQLVLFATDILLPLMVTGFLVAVSLRGLIYFTIKRHEWFAREFEKRVGRFLDGSDPKEGLSFFVIVKRLMEKTFYEIFETRAIMQRRRPDKVMTLSDRVFLIKQGSAWLVRDTLKKIRFLRRDDPHPDLMQITKTIFQRNPCFNRVLGLIPASSANDVLNMVPGMFIIAGIFGTFLGIMKALPELGGMDLADAEQTKMVMDQFLLKISFAMSTSLVGILLSVTMSFFNTLFSPDKIFIDTVDRFENSLHTLWSLSSNNLMPDHVKEFDENKDPFEALAEAAVQQEISKSSRQRDFDAKVNAEKGKKQAS